MPEYIEREATVKAFCEQCQDYIDNKCTYEGFCEVSFIEAVPAADVQSVKRGKWIVMDDVEHFIAVCSECGRTEDSRDIKDMPYCHCGARMDGDTNG